ncbi:MAG: YodL domain-containing protein, partial [Eubacterium sp.]|nr:YodL domain-containing protein [Eubacterium sp.]
IDEMIKRIDEGVTAVFESEKYKEYLKFAAQFTDYSARNTMLISLQRPDATLVAAYGKWKQLGRQVEKGEAGISILAPVTYKTNEILEVERPAVDEFGNQLYNDDGTEKTETVEKPMTGLAFKKVYVFDVSQTSGKEIPEPVGELTGDIDAGRKEAVFAAIKKVTGIDVEFRDIKGGAKGYYSAAKNEIIIKSGMSDAQTIKTAFHEAAHNLLHDPDKKIVTAKSPRNEKEVQAESVAFMVAEKFGLDTSEYSFPYIASWSDGKQLEQLKNSLQEIQAAAKKISDEIESELLKLQKRNLTMDEKLADAELNNIQKAEFLIEDCSDRGVNFSKEDTEKILEFAGNTEDIYETALLVSDMEIIQKQRDSYGYDFSYMNPIDTKEAALAAFDKGEAVYLLYPDNTEGLAENRSEIENFDGYFGTEKEPNLNEIREQNSELIPVSKEVALEMYDKGLDVFIDGEIAENRAEIENIPDNKKLYLSEFQYSAQLDFENPPPVQNAEKKNENIIGNTPYRELGGKSELQYYGNLKNRHAENIAAQLNADGIKFSGIKKGSVTTITINKADIPAYEAAVEKVKAGYDKAKNSEKINNYEKPAKPVQQSVSGQEKTDIGNTPYEEMGGKSELQIYRNLKPRHAENIAAQLNADGIKFSGVKMGAVAAIAVKKSDVPKYEAAVEKVKAGYDKAKNSEKNNFEKPVSITAAIDNAISENNFELYRYDMEKAVDSVIQKCGVQRTSKILADYINSYSYDGRISAKNKAWAKDFEPPTDRYGPVFRTHPAVLDGFIESFRDKIKSLEIKSNLSAIYDDKFLYSSERAEIRDDYRGIPETNYFNSSANEYFVDGIGWLDNSAYNYERKMSGLSAKDFYAKVTHINADYIDTEGSIGQMDMPKSDYDLMTEKTYSPENSEKLEAAKLKLQERKTAAGITEKPVEYYAVRQNTNNKFEVCTLSADGLVTPVKSGIATVAEAKKAMLELYGNKKDFVKCEFIHPQILGEKSAEIYKKNPNELPDVTYRIEINSRKNAAADNTHFLREYIKNPDDTYNVGKVICRGDFEKCNEKLADILANGIDCGREKNPDFEIYQLKNTDENRGIRFEPLERLAEQGLKPDFSSYDKIYGGDMSMLNPRVDTVGGKLEAVFVKFNLDRPEDFTGHSLSVSDVVVMDNKAYYVDARGFQPLKEFKPVEKNIEREKAVPEQDKPKPQKKPKL